MFRDLLLRRFYRHRNIINCDFVFFLQRTEMNYTHHQRHNYSLANTVFFFARTKEMSQKQASYRDNKFVKHLQDNRSIFTTTHVSFRKSHKSALNDMSNDELLLHGQDIIQELSTRKDLTEKMSDRFHNELSTILYQYFVRENEQYLVQMFDSIWKNKLCNEACYTVMMRHYARVNDIEKVKEYFHKLEIEPCISLHGRSIVPLINLYLTRKEYKMANVYFAKLVENSHKQFNDGVFCEIIYECSTLVDKRNHKELNVFIENVFSILERFGSSTLHPKTVSAIQNWFLQDPWKRWSVETTTINQNGVCATCNAILENVTIPEARLLRLKRNLMTLIESSIARKYSSRLTDVKPLKTNINIRNKIESQAKYLDFFDVVSMKTSKVESKQKNDVDFSNTANSLEVFDKLKELKQFLESNGPFDVVIDVLNVGYYTKGFNPLQVRDVVRSFANKRCLILCAGILKQGLLHQQDVPSANRRIQQLLQYLDRHCHLFFVGSSVVDDYYILYTILHQNFNIEVVSRDLFRDHLFHLDAENTSDFQRWQKANQYILQSFTADNEPVFKDRVAYKVAIQETNDRRHWHVPCTENEWMCIKKIKKIN